MFEKNQAMYIMVLVYNINLSHIELQYVFLPFVNFECHCLFQFLIEVRNANLRMVPSDWIKISA